LFMCFSVPREYERNIESVKLPTSEGRNSTTAATS
jgi:hypothetical protein